MSTQSVAAPSGACAGDPATTLDRVAEAIGEHLTGSLASYAGALWAADGNDALRLLPEALEQQLRAQVESIAGAATSCPVVALVLPAQARYVGFRYAAGQRSAMAECPPGQGCLIGEATWLGNPTIRPVGSVTVVWARFENGHAQRERLPRLTVYFEPVRTWLPPER